MVCFSDVCVPLPTTIFSCCPRNCCCLSASHIHGRKVDWDGENQIHPKLRFPSLGGARKTNSFSVPSDGNFDFKVQTLGNKYA